ncbi:MAG: hypothetical protein COA78_29705 [Blastopirellula sp.]|nr:MAG: hypothetical protein COA78_29705 [Blastopirellula sp.]
MNRSYAGTLGVVAFITVLIRGFLEWGGFESIMFSAVIALFLFAAIGYIVGSVATRIVDESVRNKLNAELNALQQEIDEHGTEEATPTLG